MKLANTTIAIVGGDEREQEIARCAATTGARVQVYGFPHPLEAIAGVGWAGSTAEALDGADYALFPIPGIAPDGALFAPAAAEPIYPGGDVLRRMRPGGAIILGAADQALRAAAAACGICLYEYEDDTELMLLRGPAIVEGALQLAIADTDVTLHGSEIGVVGHGNIGRLLARTLVLLGGRVRVFARNPVQRADARSAGATGYDISELSTQAVGLDMLFSTVPTRIVTAEVLQLMSRGLVMDLAAPPGGVDLDAAREIGHRAVWARGLGRRAPVTVGRSQWSGIAHRITQHERRAAPAKPATPSDNDGGVFS